MSASREKKNRQDQAAQGYRDPKIIKAEEEAKKQRRSMGMYILIAVAFVLVAVAALVMKSGVIQRNATALEINGEKYTPAQVNYYYYNAVSNIKGSSYASYFSLDTSSDYATQNLNDTDKMLLGVSDENIVTWKDYFLDSAKSTMIAAQSVAQQAEDEGYTFTDEMQAEKDSTMDSIAAYASSSGYSTKAYIKLLYGNVMTMSVFDDLLEREILVSYYVNDYEDSLTYTDAQLEEYYQGDKECFDVADYEYLYISGAAESTTDADGNTVEATEEEIAAAAKAAEDCLADVEKRVAAGESMEDIAAGYENETLITYSHVSNTTTNGSEVAEWAFEDGRVEGDTTTIDATVEGGTPAYYVALFHSAGRPEYNVVNVRHILIKTDSTAEDQEAAAAEAKAKAEEVLQEWKDGEATEDSFAALANQYSEDGGSNTTGGLYENIYQGQMVTTFNDWCFDASRKAGDTGIVESDYGYHVMYFSGAGDAYWKIQVRDELVSSDLQTYEDGLLDGIEAVELSGMKYVG